MHLENYEKLIDKLKPYQDVAEIQYNNLNEMIRSFKKDIEHLKKSNRNLTIAIIGQVKAGKSSFLNASLFDGKGVLPKAATPMTAALTVIRYAEEIKAEVEFYSKEDWQAVLNADKQYRRIYKETEERLEKEAEVLSGGIFGRKTEIHNVKINPQDILAAIDMPEEYQASHELVMMAEKNKLDVERFLGGRETIEDISDIENLMVNLEDYVGTKGNFTPIVKSTIVYYNDPAIKDIEIIDTPGINDPVISRGRRTKDYLGRCDVVFMLSRCGQFVDAADLQILAQNLPNSGVSNIVLIGSQLDSEMYGEHQKYSNITDLLDHLEVTLENHVERTFERVEKQCVRESEKKILQRLMDALAPIFVSSMAFNIAKHYNNLNKEEQHFLNLYNKMYDGFQFDEELLLELSNIKVVRELLLNQKEKKQEILKGRVEERAKGVQRGVDVEIQNLKDHTTRNIERLHQEDLKTLKEKEKSIIERLNRGRGSIGGSFESSIIQIQKDFSILKTEIKELSQDFSRLDEYTESRTEEYTVEVPRRFLGFNVSWIAGCRTESRSRTITYRYAHVHDAIEKVESFLVASERKIKEKMLDIIDLPKLRSEIKRGAISLFDLSDESFSVEDIIIPVERAVNRIMIPDIDIADKGYSKDISSKFNSGSVKDSDVDSLKNLQKEAVKNVLKDIEGAVSEKMKGITKTLEKTQNDFIDNLLKDFKEDLEKLRKGLEDKETTLEKYEKLLSVIDNDLKIQ